MYMLCSFSFDLIYFSDDTQTLISTNVGQCLKTGIKVEKENILFCQCLSGEISGE